MSELLPLLDNIDNLLSSDDKWTINVGARDSNGNWCSPQSPQAVCWCLTGAAWKISGGDHEVFRQIMMCFRRTLDSMDIPLTPAEYNDSGDFTRVKLLIKTARLYRDA